MQRFASPSSRLFQHRRTLRALGVFVCLVLGGLAHPAAARPAGGLPAGQWTTFANGDDILSLTLEGGTMWAGTRSGGVVRWDLASGAYRQYLRPQDPIAGNTVRDIAVGPDGRKWLGTDAGLTMYAEGDPTTSADDAWHTFNVANTAGGLSSNDIRALVVDGNLVWVGMAQVWDAELGTWSGGGVGRLDTRGTQTPTDDTWAPIATFASTYKRTPDGTETFGLVSDNVNDIALTASGDLWVATSPHWGLEKTADPDEPPTWSRMHGGVSFLDTKGTPSPTDDRWQGTSCYSMQVTLTCHVQSLAVDANGWVWAAIQGRGIMYWRANEPQLVDDRTRRIDIPERRGGDTVNAIGLGPPDVPALANTVWLARSRGGLSVLDHKGTLRNQEDDVWNFGVSLAFTTEDGLARDVVQSLVITRDTAWIGSGAVNGIAGGIDRMSIKDLTFGDRLVTRRAPTTNFVADIDFGQPGTAWDGHVWLATGSRAQRRFGAGVIDLDTRGTADVGDDVWTAHSTASTDPDGKLPWTGLIGDNVHAVKVQGDRVWFGSTESLWDAKNRKYVDGGLSVFEGGAWTSRTVENTGGGTGGLRDGSVSSLALGCDGTLWVGTGSPWDALGAGVDVLTPGASVHQRTQDTWKAHSYATLASNNTTGIAVDCAAGQVWVSAAHHMSVPDGTSPGGNLVGGGVARYDIAAGTWEKFDTRNGLVTYAESALRAEALSVAAGPGGRVWVGGYGTAATSTEALVNDKPFWPAVINQWNAPGWRNAVFERSGWVSDIALDAGGRLWVGTTRGGTARDAAAPESWRTDGETGGLWVFDSLDVTASPLAVLRPETSGIVAGDISVVAVAPNGDIWFGTEGWGVARYRMNGDAPTPTPTGPASATTPSTATQVATASSTATPRASASPTRATVEATPTRQATPTAGTGGGRAFLPIARQVRASVGPTATRPRASATPRATRTSTPTAGATTPGTPTPGIGATPTATDDATAAASPSPTRMATADPDRHRNYLPRLFQRRQR